MISLKLKYAAFILVTLIMLLSVGWGITLLVVRSHYVWALLGLALLYPVMFYLGKRCTKIYFILSSRRFLKKHSGSVATTDLIAFIVNSLAGKKSASEAEQFAYEIIDLLKSEKMVVIVENKAVLIDH